MRWRKVPGCSVWGLTIQILPLTEPLLPAMPSALYPCSPSHPVFSLPCSSSSSHRCSGSSLRRLPKSGTGVPPGVPSALCAPLLQHWSCCVVVICLCVCLPIRLVLLEDRGLVLTHLGPPGSSRGLAPGRILGNLWNERTGRC